MTKKEIMKKLGISDESFGFYTKMGKIWKVGRNKFSYSKKLERQILEKSTVFKYSFNDGFIEDQREFLKSIKYTGKCKKFSKKEIKELEEKMRLEGKLNKEKK